MRSNGWASSTPRRRAGRRSQRATASILPGVGAARATLDSLAESGLVEPLTRLVRRRRDPVPRHLHRAPGALRALGGGRHRLPRLDPRHRPPVPDTATASRRSAGTRSRFRQRAPGDGGVPRRRALLLRELVLRRPDGRRTTSLGATDVRRRVLLDRRAPTTSSPRSSTPRRAAPLGLAAPRVASRRGSRRC